MEKRSRRETFLIVATILGLHVALIWLLIANSRTFPPTPVASALELIVVPPVQPALSLLPRIAGEPPDATHGRANRRPSPGGPVTAPPGAAEAQPAATDHSIHLPTDWNSELGRAAGAAIARESVPQPRDFGFPKRSQPPPETHPFEWDYNATHRVESMPEGGIVVHLNDNCVLVMFPLPFMGCAIGKKPANGQLFEHMRDAPAPPSEAAP